MGRYYHMTMIIAAIGLNSFMEDKVRKIILAGADILRFNFSYRTIEQNIEYIKSALETINNLNASVDILIDFPLNKIRLGDFDIKRFAVRENEEFIFQSATFSPDCNQFIPVDIKNLGQKVKTHQTITIGDGEVSIYVTEIIDEQKIKARILNNGIIFYIKSFNINSYTSDDILLKNYQDILEKTKSIEPEYIAFSYINKEINQKIKDLIISKKIRAKKIIKIEKFITNNELRSICEENFYDMIMLDSGEMGVNMPFEKIGILQKEILKIANQYKKQIIISTQILESTMNNLTPNRAEILDLTNLIIEGASGIMLCHETAIGVRPAYSINIAKKIIAEAIKYRQSNKII